MSKAIEAEDFTAESTGHMVCNATRILYRPSPAGEPQNPCPFDQFDAGSPRALVRPQPPDNPCSSCSITQGSPGYRLFIEIEDSWQGGPLHDATLTIGETNYHLGLDPLVAGDSAIVVNIEDPPLGPDADVPIFVSFWSASDGDQVSVQSPVFFAP